MAPKTDPRATAPTATLEVESKFSAGPEVVVPNFDFIPQVGSSTTEVRSLSAVYLDTEDLRLTRSKHTLRRRTGGPDEGWHLKAPGKGGRLEYGVGLDSGSVSGEGSSATYEVPEELLAPVRSMVRDHRLRPIAQVDNERRVTTVLSKDGDPMAEFADDHVTAFSMLEGGEKTTWREWEIELLGDWADRPEGQALMAAMSQVAVVAGAAPSESPSKLATALGDSVNSAPLPPTPAKLPKGTPGRTVVDALAANVQKMIEVDPKVRRDEWDSVHQMRVATRELRSHLQTFHGIVVGDRVRELERDLKQLAGVLGVARDAEVVAMRWEELLARPEGETLGEELREHLVEDVRKDYHRAHRRVVLALSSPQYFALLDDLEALLANPPIATGEDQELDAENTTEDAPAPETSAEDKEEMEQEELDTTAVLASHLRSAFKKFQRRHELAVSGREEGNLPESQIDERFHDVRKAAKKLRYSAEAAQNAGLPTSKLYSACKNLQSVLGDFQDTCTAREFVVARADRAFKAGKNTFGYGVLYQMERYDGLRALEDYDESVSAVFKAFKKMESKVKKAKKS